MTTSESRLKLTKLSFWTILEWCFWPLLLLGVALLTATTDYFRDTKAGAQISFFLPLSRELISASVILVLLPVIIAIGRKYPWQKIGLIAYIGLHLVLSVPFTFLHIFGTITLRLAWPLLTVADLNFAYVMQNLIYEYPKDLIAYVQILIVLNVYGWLRFSIAKADSIRIESDQIAIKTLSGVVLLNLSNIEWIEAAKNYVVFHINNKKYFLRSSMQEIEGRFSKRGFIRIHRSHIINQKMISEITKFSAKDSEVVLISGQRVRIGRQYKQALLEATSKDILGNPDRSP